MVHNATMAVVLEGVVTWWKWKRWEGEGRTWKRSSLAVARLLVVFFSVFYSLFGSYFSIFLRTYFW